MKIKLRYHPELEPGEVAEFIAGRSKPAQAKIRCVAINNCTDETLKSELVRFKFCPESLGGDLKQQSVARIWSGMDVTRVRDILERCGLLPVCSKCNFLYAPGV